MNTPGSSADQKFAPGTVVANRFEVKERIGSGGMGLVYRAIDRELEDEVALKLLHPHLAEDENVFRRFRNEVLVARSLSHPNIVRTHDIGRAEDGYSYISMELVRGQSLREYVQDEANHAPHSEGLIFEHAVSILLHVLAGISYAHGKGIIHRDLKPANVLISQDGEVKLADFGTARIIGMDTSITRTGQVVGTPDYMSPEQIRGEKLDQLCDVYAMGIIAYELVVGDRPFFADSPVAVAFKHLNEPIPEFATTTSGIPAWFDAVVRKAAAKKKEERFINVSEYARELIQHMPALSTQSGFFPVEATNFLSGGQPAASGGVDATIASTGTGASELPEPRPPVDKRSEKKFELGTEGDSTGTGGWTLDYAISAPDVSAETSTPAAANDKKKRGALPYLIALALFVFIGAPILVRALPSVEERVADLLYPEATEPNHLTAAFAAFLGVSAPSVELEVAALDTPSTTEVDEQREQLRMELLGFTGEQLDSAEVLGKNDDVGPVEVKKIKEPAPSATPEASVAKEIEPTPPPPEKETVVEPTPTPAPVPLVATSFMLRQGSKELSSGSISLDSLRGIRWEAELQGLSGVSNSKIRERLTVNVFDPNQAAVITKLTASKVSTKREPVQVSGGFAELKKAKPDTGSLRIDLVYDGEVLSSKPLSLYKARVSFSGRQSAQSGGISIVRVPTMVEPQSDGNSKKTTGVSVPNPSTTERVSTPKAEPTPLASAAPIPAASPIPVSRPSREAQPFVPKNFNRRSSELPPARLPAGTVPSTTASRSLPTSSLPGFSAEPSVVQAEPLAVRDTYAGSLDVDGQQRALTLRIAFQGATISGSASVSGFASFRVRGKVYPRGLELELLNSSDKFRLTGARRDRSLRGRYQLFQESETKRGSWQAEQLN